MQKKRAMTGLSLALITVFVFGLTIALNSFALAGQTIQFAVAGPMTGDSAAMGIQMKKGAEIAVDEINAAGGINGKKLEVYVGDDEANPQKATILAQKLASKKDLLFVLGHNNSGCSIAALPTYEKVSLPVISPVNTAPSLTQLGHKNYFRVCPNDQLVVEQQILMGIKELDIKKPAIIWENTDYGKSLRDLAADSLEKLNIKLLSDDSYVPQVDRDYSSHATKLKALGVDGVFFMGEYTATALFLKQARNMALDLKVICSSGAANTQLINIAGESGEGTYVITMFDPNDERPLPASFIADYQKKYGEKPGDWGAHSYDIVKLVKAAIEKGAHDRKSLIEELHKLPDYQGVTGKIKFDQYGDVPGKKAAVLLVKDGKFNGYIPTKY